MPRFVDIALPVGIDREFTYLLPPELEESAAVGVRVLVPFGRQQVTGLIVGFPADCTLASLKPVRDIIDAAPIVSDELLGLCRWIARYYVAPLGEVLKAAVPHGFATSRRRVVRPSATLTVQTVDDLRGRAPKRAALLAMLLKEGECSSADLQKRCGLKTVNAVLNELLRAGFVEMEDVLPRSKARPKTADIVNLDAMDEEMFITAGKALSPRKRKARLLLEAVAAMRRDGRHEIWVAELLKRSGVSSAVMKEFRQSGLLPVTRREITRQQEYGTEERTLSIVLNAAQEAVLARITAAMQARAARTFLLHGVTGSGKTQVYIEAIRACLADGKSAIVLVPEISLTPQIVRRFKSHFGDQVTVVHSRMSAGERYDSWRLAGRGDCRVVIGPRSAVFAPLADLGLIVVDEEHEASYKQFDASPRYHARDVAVVRGSLCHAVVVLGSATPSTESYSNAAAGKYELLEMPHRIEAVTMPEIAVVDMGAERRRAYAAAKEALPEEKRMKLKDFQHSPVSALLKEKIEDRLARKEGVILLQNRRGFAPFVECPDCGYVEMCENCNVTMTFHMTQRHLRCHYCGLIRPPHTVCPQCSGSSIKMHGIGTQRVEQELARLFPRAHVVRMDLDTTSRKGAHDRLLKRFEEGEADILLGTQMVAKGLDFPRVTLVGVISADTQMLLPDFRASERTFQLLTQVSGRAGRSTLKGEVVIQTYQPDHYTLRHVVDHDYASFYAEELEARRELDYPPFSRLVLIEAKGPVEEDVRAMAERFGACLQEGDGGFSLLGPSPAVIGKINNQYRWHIILKSIKTHDPSGTRIHQAIRTALKAVEKRRMKEVRLIVDVDPVGLM